MNNQNVGCGDVIVVLTKMYLTGFRFFPERNRFGCFGRLRRRREGECVGGCENYGPFLDPYYNTPPNM